MTNQQETVKQQLEAMIAKHKEMWVAANKLATKSMDEFEAMERKRHALGNEIDALAKANGLKVEW